jgi:hypothetical protein
MASTKSIGGCAAPSPARFVLTPGAMIRQPEQLIDSKISCNAVVS